MLFNKGYSFDKHTLEQRIEFIKSMLDYPSLYLKKDLKQKLLTIQIASDISQAANLIAALSETVDKVFKQKNILAIS